MKTILKTILLCAGMVSFSACSDFLQEEPKSSLTSAAYNQTESQMIEQVNYLYRHGAPDKLANMTGAYRGSSASVSCMLTGYFTNAFEGQEIDCYYARVLDRQGNTQAVCSYQTNGVWTDCYKVINIANNVLKYIGDVDMTDPAKYEGETRFFRAMNYFYLVKMFGDVPLVTEPTEGTIEYPERTSLDTIYTELIIPDLEYAVENLPATTFTSNGHRITKYAAEMLLSDVYMMREEYAKATDLLKDVISNSGASLTTNDDLGLGSAYNKLRENDDLSEVIYAYEYDGSIENTGNLPTHAFNGASESLFNTYSLWVNVFRVSNSFLNIYEENDLRIQPNQFFHWTYTNPNTGKSITFENNGQPEACNWYWYDEQAILETAIGTKDWNFYRYAEALLSGAECIARTEGVTAEAVNYLAMVKARANMEGKSESELASQLAGLSQEAFIEECWKERLRELPLEMKIWDDCLRTKKFPQVSTSVKGEIQFVDLIGAINGSGAVFKQTDLYWPIPVEEIQRNPNLTQNDGYSRQ